MGVLNFNRGDDHTVLIIFEDKNGNRIDITGGSVKFAIKKRLSDPDSEAIYLNAAVPITDAAQGEATDLIPDATTIDWSLGSWFWQARYIDSALKVKSSQVDKAVISDNLLDNE